MKLKCPTFFRSKGKAMAITFNDDEVSDHESSSYVDKNFITFTATAVVDESIVVEENPSNGELFEFFDL